MALIVLDEGKWQLLLHGWPYYEFLEVYGVLGWNNLFFQESYGVFRAHLPLPQDFILPYLFLQNWGNNIHPICIGSLELHPIISQTRPVHLQPTASSPDHRFGAVTREILGIITGWYPSVCNSNQYMFTSSGFRLLNWKISYKFL